MLTMADEIVVSRTLSTTRVITVITKYNHGVLQVATVLYLPTLQVSRLVGLVLAFSVLFTGETARP